MCSGAVFAARVVLALPLVYVLWLECKLANACASCRTHESQTLRLDVSTLNKDIDAAVCVLITNQKKVAGLHVCSSNRQRKSCCGAKHDVLLTY